MIKEKLLFTMEKYIILLSLSIYQLNGCYSVIYYR